MNQTFPVVVGRGNVIDNVYIVYLYCDIVVLLYNCCINKEKLENCKEVYPCTYTSLPLALG